MQKSFLFLVLALLMALSFLSGCKKSEKPEEAVPYEKDSQGYIALAHAVAFEGLPPELKQRAEIFKCNFVWVEANIDTAVYDYDNQDTLKSCFHVSIKATGRKNSSEKYLGRISYTVWLGAWSPSQAFVDSGYRIYKEDAFECPALCDVHYYCTVTKNVETIIAKEEQGEWRIINRPPSFPCHEIGVPELFPPDLERARVEAIHAFLPKIVERFALFGM